MSPSTARNRHRLRIRAFYFRLSLSAAAAAAACRDPLPATLTLVYLPRIDGSLLEVNGTKIRADAPAIVHLHRVRSPQETMYASTDRVRVGRGSRFEVYVGEEKLMGGSFRRRGGAAERGWALECRAAAEGKVPVAAEAAEVWVVEEGGPEVEAAVLRGKVDVAAEAAKWMRRRARERFCLKLEEIPEESDDCEGDDEEEVDGDDSKEMDGVDSELQMKGVRWAVDVGLLLMCLGVGILVSRRTSSRALRSKIF